MPQQDLRLSGPLLTDFVARGASVRFDCGQWACGKEEWRRFEHAERAGRSRRPRHRYVSANRSTWIQGGLWPAVCAETTEFWAVRGLGIETPRRLVTSHRPPQQLYPWASHWFGLCLSSTEICGGYIMGRGVDGVRRREWGERP
jgi:hypothetical protein